MENLTYHHSLKTAMNVKHALKVRWNEIKEVNGKAWIESYNNIRMQGLRLNISILNQTENLVFLISEDPAGTAIRVYAGPSTWFDYHGMPINIPDGKIVIYDFRANNPESAASWILTVVRTYARDGGDPQCILENFKMALTGKPGMVLAA